MSTYWGYVCRSHDPELISEHWFNHGEEALTKLFHQFRSGPWPENDWGELLETEVKGDRTSAPVYWLRDHQHCVVALHNEYDKTQEIPQTVAERFVIVVDEIAYTPTRVLGPYATREAATQVVERDYWAKDIGAAVVPMGPPT